MEQIQVVNPPPNPAKITDSRYERYVSKYGTESWELDALEPQYLVDLIREEILAERNNGKWEEAYNQQETERQKIAEVIANWK